LFEIFFWFDVTQNDRDSSGYILKISAKVQIFREFREGKRIILNYVIM